DCIGQDYPQQAADKSNGKSLCEELKQDVPAAGAERLFHSNFTSALGDGDQHDVHQTDAADAQGQRADKAKKNLQADGDDFELMNLLHQVEDAQGTAVGLIELVFAGQYGAGRLLQS